LKAEEGFKHNRIIDAAFAMRNGYARNHCAIFEPDLRKYRRKWQKKYLPHEISDVARCDISFSRSIESLKGCIGLKCLRLAQVLPTKLNPLLGLTRVRKKLGQLFLGLNRHVCSLHG